MARKKLPTYMIEIDDTIILEPDTRITVVGKDGTRYDVSVIKHITIPIKDISLCQEVKKYSIFCDCDPPDYLNCGKCAEHAGLK